MNPDGIAVGKSARDIFLKSRYAPALFISLLFVASAIFYWNGIGPGDAERYIGPALLWLSDGVNLGDTHWSLRLPFVLPMAASFALFGPGEFSAALPNILYAAGLVAITFWFGRRYLGAAEGFAAAGFIATSAYFVARPLEVEVYGAEAFFAALAVWLFIASSFEKRRLTLLFFSGLAAGFAFALREQACYVAGAIGLLILAERRDIWRAGLALSAGFALVVGAEILFYTVVAGDPFYRFRIDLGHREIGTNVEFKGAAASPFRRFTRMFVDVLSYAALTPFLLIAAALAWRPGWRLALAPETRKKALLVFVTISAIALPVSALIFNLSFARYYPILPYTIFLVIGVGAAAIWRRYGRLWGVAFIALVTLANAAATDFSRYNEYAEVRVLADLAAQSDEPIFTDGMTAFRARYQLAMRGFSLDEAAQRIISTKVATPGALFFKTYATPHVSPNWCVLKSIDARPLNWTHAILRGLGFETLGGGKVASIIAAPEPVLLVRALDGPAVPGEATSAPCLHPKER